MKDATTFKSAYFMSQQQWTKVCVREFNGSMDTLKETLNEQGLNLRRLALSLEPELIEIDGFSEDFSKSHNQITNLLEAIGVPEYIHRGYQFYDDRVGFESVSFNGTTVLLSNFLSSDPWRPKSAQFKDVGEIVNYGREIYAIKLPKFNRDYTFAYPITEHEYNSFRHCDYHTFEFKDGMFAQIIEFPPIFLLRGTTHAVDFFERFLEINGFDLTDYGEDWFQEANQVKAYYL